MRTGKASYTAQQTAYLRAAHQIFDNGAIFCDPTALAIIGKSEQELRDLWVTYPQELTTRMLMACRARFAEDNLKQAVNAGIRQYVVLGAGLDTFAIRNPYSKLGLKVFEVDHPDTQAWKRERLLRSNLKADAAFTPVDFERQDLTEELARAGFDHKAPACFSWLGVVMYLTGAASDATFRMIAALPQGSSVTFDYAAFPQNPAQAEFDVIMRTHLEGLGEPVTAARAPDVFAAGLRNLGFAGVKDYPLAEFAELLGVDHELCETVWRIACASTARS